MQYFIDKLKKNDSYKIASDIDREFLVNKLLHLSYNYKYTIALPSNEASESDFYYFFAYGDVALTGKENEENHFEALKKFVELGDTPVLGYFNYDLKNEIEDLTSNNPSHFPASPLCFFKPSSIVIIRGMNLYIDSTDGFINKYRLLYLDDFYKPKFPRVSSIKSDTTKEAYLHNVNKIKAHIKRGDIYEMNYALAFHIDDYVVNPAFLFHKLNTNTFAPFASFFKQDNRYVLCASPERFLQKKGNQLLSQPIKGTIKRHSDPDIDENLKKELYQSEKNRAENVMIVDLVRNDFARSCKAGSIKVQELFGVHTFAQVHHLISSVIGELRPEVHPLDALKNAFPMGSMTGAPKIMSMKLIEEYENSMRNIYAGAIGYITPDMDFDFNVVIRSMFYDSTRKKLSFHVGGAIVYDSNPEEEYQECWLKAKGILQTLGVMTS